MMEKGKEFVAKAFWVMTGSSKKTRDLSSSSALDATSVAIWSVVNCAPKNCQVYSQFLPYTESGLSKWTPHSSSPLDLTSSVLASDFFERMAIHTHGAKVKKRVSSHMLFALTSKISSH
jgi:hypothetical protein